MFRRGPIYFVIACVLAVPSGATAQEPVQVDPDSPAGVEYQLPLEQARRDAAPGGGGGRRTRSGGGSGAPVPLFGAGITRDGSQSGGGADGNRGGAEQSGDRGDRGASGADGGEATGSRAGPAENGGGSSGLFLGGIAVAVLVLGGALGLALRRGLRTIPAS